MKRSELMFGAVLVPIDFAALVVAGALAYLLRTSELVQHYRPAIFELQLPFFEYMQMVVIVAALIVGIFAMQGLYALESTRRVVEVMTRIFSGVSMGIMALIVFAFFSAELFQSRFIVLTAYALGIAMVGLGRWLVRRIQVQMLKRGFGVHRVVLVGNGRFAKQLERIFRNKQELGYRVVARSEMVKRVELERIYRRHGIDEIIKTDPSLTDEDNAVLLDFCDKYKIDYKYVPDLYEAYATNLKFSHILGVPMVELLRTPLDGWGRIAKRIVDVLGSISGLAILMPLFMTTGLAIKMDTRGPIFYRQRRVGKNMREFEIFKFRSMEAEFCTGENYGGKKAHEFESELREKLNERKGPLFKMKNDPRITKVGRFIRRTRIDELPQLINVLKGEMSLVGPRPHLPAEVNFYTRYHRKLFTIKPGMTGMAQVHGNAGLAFEQEAKLDIGYIEEWSLWLDTTLLLKTMRILFTDPHAV